MKLSLDRAVAVALLLVGTGSLATLSVAFLLLQRDVQQGARQRLTSQQEVLAQQILMMCGLPLPGTGPRGRPALLATAQAFEARLALLERDSLAVEERARAPRAAALRRLRADWDVARRELAPRAGSASASIPRTGATPSLDSLAAVIADVDALVLLDEEEADDRRTLTRRVLVALSVTAAGVWILGALLVRREVLVPVRRIESVVRAFRRGSLDQRVDERGATELRTLARAFNEMATSLQDLLDRHRRSEADLSRLTADLLRLQDDERRRIARELHDGTVQTLAALSMDLARVRPAVHGETALSILEESEALVESCSRELRTLSQLLHPPLLEEIGLDAALRWLTRGFARRSGLAVDLRVEPGFGRLVPDDETAVFRMVQECLGNVYRHSGGTRAFVRVRAHNGRVVVVVRDDGRGLAPPPAVDGHGGGVEAGVGLAGLRERLRQLGGTLDFPSCPRGAVVRARLPLRRVPS